MKYQELADYYYRIAGILKTALPFIPGLQLSNATTYYGSYWRKDNRSTLTLSTVTCYPIDHVELVDTICHELAHVIFPDHNRMHETATKHFIFLVNQEFSCTQ